MSAEFQISKRDGEFTNVKKWKEHWLPVLGFESLYAVSNVGRIKSLGKSWVAGGGSIHIRKELIRKNVLMNGYYFINLANKSFSKKVAIHRLVAMAFIPNPDNKPCVNHKNGIKTDNTVSNLEWCSFKENAVHAHKTGLAVNKKGQDHSCAKLTDEDVLYIRNSTEPTRVLTKRFGVIKGTIYSIKKRINWRHL